MKNPLANKTQAVTKTRLAQAPKSKECVSILAYVSADSAPVATRIEHRISNSKKAFCAVFQDVAQRVFQR
jgi:hypothetical protein